MFSPIESPPFSYHSRLKYSVLHRASIANRCDKGHDFVLGAFRSSCLTVFFSICRHLRLISAPIYGRGIQGAQMDLGCVRKTWFEIVWLANVCGRG